MIFTIKETTFEFGETLENIALIITRQISTIISVFDDVTQ